MELKRVVVTGLGALTPIGNSVEEYWDGLLNGKSGAAPITLFDAEKFKENAAHEQVKMMIGINLAHKCRLVGFLWRTTLKPLSSAQETPASKHIP